MKHLLIILFSITFISTNLFSQIIFEPGYYIDNSDKKHECFIKNIDWLDNPTNILYKIDLDKKENTLSIDDIKEFGINNISKYERHYVQINRSSDITSELTFDKIEVTKTENLLLKLIIKGKYTLYAYYDNSGNIRRFYYSKNNSKIIPLKYRRYIKPDFSIAVNQSYKQELFNNLKCHSIKNKTFNKLKYNIKDLSEIFILYHKCNNIKYQNYLKYQVRDLFNFSIKLGAELAFLKIDLTTSNKRDADFGNKLNLKYGFELEYILPFNKNKWSIFMDPSYHTYSNKKVISTKFASGYIFNTVTVKYNSIEIPVGLRYYLFLNKKIKLFVNSAYSFNISHKSNIDFENGVDLDISSRNSIALGTGINYKNKLSAELRASIFRDILGNYILWSSNYSYISFTLGYNLFHL